MIRNFILFEVIFLLSFTFHNYFKRREKGVKTWKIEISCLNNAAFFHWFMDNKSIYLAAWLSDFFFVNKSNLISTVWHLFNLTISLEQETSYQIFQTNDFKKRLEKKCNLLFWKFRIAISIAKSSSSFLWTFPITSFNTIENIKTHFTKYFSNKRNFKCWATNGEPSIFF